MQGGDEARSKEGPRWRQRRGRLCMEERVAGFSDNPPPTVKWGCSRMLGKWKSAAECAPQEPPLAHNRRRSPPPRVGRRRPFFAQVERMDWARPIVGSQTSISFSRRRVNLRSVFGRFVSRGFFLCWPGALAATLATSRMKPRSREHSTRRISWMSA